MPKMNKLKKITILGASALALLCIGGIPSVQNTTQNVMSYITMPISHADNHNTFNLSKRVTSKQFTVGDGDNGSTGTFSEMNKKVDTKVDHYLSSVNNLSDYQYHISRTGSLAQANTGAIDSETATITFVRKPLR